MSALHPDGEPVVVVPVLFALAGFPVVEPVVVFVCYAVGFAGIGGSGSSGFSSRLPI